MFQDYEVKIQFTGKLMAGLPRDPKAIITLMEVRGRPDLVAAVSGEVAAEPSAEPVSRLVFKRNEAGLYVEGYTWKAHLKDCARVLAGIVKKGGMSAFRSKLADRVYVVDEHIPIMRNGQQAQEADDEYVHPISVMTAMGPRTSVKVNEFVVGPECLFTLRVLVDGTITEAMLRDCFTYGSLHGYGPERGLGFGRYDFDLAKKEATG